MRATRSLAVVSALLVLLAGVGCGDEAPSVQRMETVQLGDRPFTLYVPGSYRVGTAAPLLVLLHGYTGYSAGQEAYMRIAPEANRRGILYAVPDGIVDQEGNRFWNATDACCNFYGSTVDDSTYLTEVIASVSQRYTVDPARVYLTGFSNGAFMSFRMACEHADLIAAIVAINGAMLNDPSQCRPAQPVSVLNVRGDADDVIRNQGGLFRGNRYPSTESTVSSWVTFNGCTASPEGSASPLDLESSVDGPETSVTTYGGCQRGTTVALWTIRGGPHVPAFTEDFVPALLDFLLAHSAT